jgi:hypothetical protein
MAEPSYVYAGTVRSAAGGSGGIFRQTAGDQRWEALTNGLPDETQVHAITGHPARHDAARTTVLTTQNFFPQADRSGPARRGRIRFSTKTITQPRQRPIRRSGCPPALNPCGRRRRDLRNHDDEWR